MEHIVRETDWCTIDLDTTAGRVFFQQRWAYTWLPAAGQATWTLEEKREFHNRSDQAIWAIWSNRARLPVSGTSEFAKRFAKRGVPINLDVRWVLAGQHWSVKVTKVPTADFYPSQIFWNTRIVDLGSNDFRPRHFSNFKTPRTQFTVAHEFGHALGNTWVLKRGDEYKGGSPHSKDYRSIMHTGSELRRRHFRTIIEQLNTMIPNTTFSLAAVS